MFRIVQKFFVAATVVGLCADSSMPAVDGLSMMAGFRSRKEKAASEREKTFDSCIDTMVCRAFQGKQSHFDCIQAAKDLVSTRFDFKQLQSGEVEPLCRLFSLQQTPPEQFLKDKKLPGLKNSANGEETWAAIHEFRFGQNAASILAGFHTQAVQAFARQMDAFDKETLKTSKNKSQALRASWAREALKANLLKKLSEKEKALVREKMEAHEILMKIHPELLS